MQLNFRLHRPDDRPALIRLWREHSGWDEVTAETWTHRFLSPPLGEACIVVAEDTQAGTIEGQFVFFPCEISVQGRKFKGVRPFAPVVSRAARGSALSLVANPLGQPVIAMYLHAVKALSERGYALAYMVPDPFWARLFRFFPALVSGSFPLWSVPLPWNPSQPLHAGLTARRLEQFDASVDRLAEAALGNYSCQLVRDARMLPWKLSHGAYETWVVERPGELVGLIAAQAKGDRQWLLCDLLTADNDESLRATLITACQVADRRARSAPAEQPLRKAAILATPLMQPILSELGFQPDNYKFPFVVHPFDEAVTKAAVAPEKWYVSAND